MKKAISKALLRLAGWKLGPVVEDVPKCVICVAPHTSNWDFIVGKLFYTSIGRNASFLIKKEWFFFPFNLLFDWLGGVPVDRSKRTSVTDQMVGQFNRRKEFQLAVTPEGTRKRVDDWKKGFYYIAQKAQVPIVLVGIDYTTKTISSTKAIMPTGDIEKDMREIKLYFKDFKGKHPENFSIGDIDE